MVSYDYLKAEMETIPQQMIKANKIEHSNSLKQVKLLFKVFGFTAEILKSSLAEERKKS